MSCFYVIIYHMSFVVISLIGEMFTATSTNSAAEYGVTMDSPLFNQRHSPAEERLKRRLRFFFLNPVQKWAATRRFPFKLFTQIIKIIFVTVQVSHSIINQIIEQQSNDCLRHAVVFICIFPR